MKLIISIDTEEDNWGGYTVANPTARNIAALPSLQAMFDEYGVTPTYFVSYIVANDPRAAAILREINASGRCEIGSHCHPWNTPPVVEELGERNSMMCNLPSDLQLRKLTTLHQTLCDRLQVTPRAFRTGRFGFSQTIAKHLKSLGYLVDSSVSPTADWRPAFGPDYAYCGLLPYRFSPDDDIFTERATGAMVEVPVTIGFYQANFDRMNAIFQRLRHPPLSYLRLIGLLGKMKLMNRVWLDPELSTAEQMITLARCMRREGYPLLNMVFHSPTLCAGLTPYVKTTQDEHAFRERIREFCAFAKAEGIESTSYAAVAQSMNMKVGAVA